MSDGKFDLYRYKRWSEAYPNDIFTPLEGSALEKTGDYDTKEKRNLITRASAGMARHMIDRFGKPMIEEIERLRKENEELMSRYGALEILRIKCDEKV